MKGLAEWVMRGRMQALAVALAGSFSVLFCWLSAAVVALVTLRRGAGEGAWLFLWTLLPAGSLVYLYGDSGPLALLAGTLALALVLRASVSLSLALLASIAVGVVAGLALVAFGGAYLDQLAAMFAGFLETMEQRLEQGGEPVVLPRPQPVQIAGMLGAGTAVSAVLCLLLARYWQAALYNPGGLGREFRALRYPPAVSAALVVAGLALSSLGQGYRSWAMICFVPLSFAGLALVHARVAWRGRGAGWLAWFYLAWLIFDPVKLVVIFLAIADSWLDFRGRWQGAGGRAGGGDGDDGGKGDGRDDERDL